jgi:hypothetical protein
MMAYFAGEPAALSAPMLSAARMDTDDWLALLPAMPSASRSILRHRRDLDATVVQALASFGSTDFVISGAIGDGVIAEDLAVAADLPLADAEGIRPPDPALQRGEAQIRELVARIEAFRRRAAPVATPTIPMPSENVAASSNDWPRLESFRWETGADGVILWVEGAPREALIGQSIALASSGGDAGVDAQASGAFSRRAPFRDARLWIAGACGPVQTDAQRQQALLALGYPDLLSFQNATPRLAQDAQWGPISHAAMTAALRRLGAASPVPVPARDQMLDAMVRHATGTAFADRVAQLRQSGAFEDVEYQIP